MLTKHLKGADTLLELLGKFRCAYCDGTSVAAPRLRVAVRTTNGEQLAQRSASEAAYATFIDSHKRTQWRDGRWFPKVDRGDAAHDLVQDLPEAYHMDPGKLPHNHGDLEEKFPLAVACGELTDKSFESEEVIEACGQQLGSWPDPETRSPAAEPLRLSQLGEQRAGGQLTTTTRQHRDVRRQS